MAFPLIKMVAIPSEYRLNTLHGNVSNYLFHGRVFQIRMRDRHEETSNEVCDSPGMDGVIAEIRTLDEANFITNAITQYLVRRQLQYDNDFVIGETIKI